MAAGVPKKYPLVDLKKEYEMLSGDIDNAIHGVISRSEFILGSALESFEKAFARYCGVRHCIGVGSGTAALFMALHALNIGEGDAVIIPAYTFKATAMAVMVAGARPVLVDVREDTGNMDPELLREAVTPDVKAIIPVHLYGHSADMDSIMEIARESNLIVIEDACEAHGALYKGKRAGSIGRCGAFSFYPSKNLGGYGDGGCITTNDDKLADTLRAMRAYGNGSFIGYNSRLSTINGAVLGVKLPHLEDFNRKRKEIADKFRQKLSGLPLEFPVVRECCDHVYYLFVLKTDNRDELKAHLVSKGIEARVHFDKPVHLEENFPSLHSLKGSFPNSENLCKRVLSLPMHPFLTDEDVDYITDSIIEFYKG